ncbi:MAG: hypothetical protein ACRD5H_14645, partial [Nitrososphaerales archaeon]
DQAVRNYGWFIPDTRFYDTYAVFVWFEDNVESKDLILNDRSMSSFFIDGTSSKNLTHSYATGFLKYAPSSHPRLEMAKELNMIWLYPNNTSLVDSLLHKHDVRYVTLMPERGYQDYANWGGTGKYVPLKHYRNVEYEKIFNSYPFMKLVFKSGDASVFAVQ